MRFWKALKLILVRDIETYKFACELVIRYHSKFLFIFLICAILFCPSGSKSLWKNSSRYLSAILRIRLLYNYTVILVNFPFSIKVSICILIFFVINQSIFQTNFFPRNRVANYISWDWRKKKKCIHSETDKKHKRSTIKRKFWSRLFVSLTLFHEEQVTFSAIKFVRAALDDGLKDNQIVICLINNAIFYLVTNVYSFINNYFNTNNNALLHLDYDF